MITVKDMMNWLDEHDKNYTQDGVQEIYDAWLEAKTSMIERFRKHPNWDENAMAIVLKESQYNRGFYKPAIRDFNVWCCTQIDNILREINHNAEVDILDDKIYEIGRVITSYSNELKRTFSNFGINPLVNGEPMIMALWDIHNPLIAKRNKYTKVRGFNVEKDIADKYIKVISALGVLKDADDFLMTQELADNVNAIINVKAVSGQKVSKVIKKICAHIGLDKIKDLRPYTNIRGEQEMKDYGFNREYAMLTDQINPIQYKKITVISLNPLDYWSMSHGKKWVSCHYVGDGEDGCYSSGTESYMLDETSIIYYIIDEDYEGTEYFSQKKEKRCVFCIEPNGDMILQSRVYPDGRDGGDQTLSGQMRTVMQKLVSELWDKNNYWDLKKGKENCKSFTTTKGTHYPDYTYYDDCNVSINKDLKENKKIVIGHRPICPECGGYHDDTEDITCSLCNDDYCCDYCGDRINRDEEIYCEDNGNHYCCELCAENDDVYYCSDDYEWHHIDNCFYDDYLGEYHSGEPEVEAEDGTKYASYDNAWNNDYETDEDGYWYPRSELVWCEDEDIYVHEDSSDLIHTEDDKFFSCESAANSNDYYEDINGDWYHEDHLRWCDDEDVYVHEDDAIYIEDDDKYFSSEESAEEEGYHKTEDGNWVKESEVA